VCRKSSKNKKLIRAIEQPALSESQPLWSLICGTLNTLDYCESVLKEWADQVIFLELMQFEISQSKSPSHSNANANATNDTNNDDSALSSLLSSMPLLPSVLKPNRTPTSASSTASNAAGVLTSFAPSSSTTGQRTKGGALIETPRSNATSDEEVPTGSNGLFAPIIIEFNDRKLHILNELVDIIWNRWQLNTALYRTSGFHMTGGPINEVLTSLRRIKHAEKCI
jgi:hypothetical protein